jgi:predicted helicase
MHHMMQENRGLICSRIVKSDHFGYGFCANTIADGSLMATNTCSSTYLIPLYLYPDSIFMGSDDKKPNISSEIFSVLSKRYQKVPDPEEIFCYIYAMLYSGRYRQRYAEFLKTDFPRIPFTRSSDLFEALSRLGSELVSLHLLESQKLDKFITAFPVPGDNAVSQAGEKGKTLKNIKDGKGRLYINKTQYFDGIPETVWNFCIGGYQVCYKWLYDRKKAGRRLSGDDIRHYHRIIAALNETLRIMQEIDDVIDAHGGFPIQ